MKKSLLALLSIVCVSFFFTNCVNDNDDPNPSTPQPTTPTTRDMSYVVAFNDSIFQFVDISFKFLHQSSTKTYDTVTVPMSAMTLIDDPTSKKEWTETIRGVQGKTTDTIFHFYAYKFSQVPIGDVLKCTNFTATIKKTRPAVETFNYLLGCGWSPYELKETGYHKEIWNTDSALNKFFNIVAKSYLISTTVK